MKKIIVLASDHNGVELKEKVKNYLKKKDILALDIGPFDTNKKVDYVDYADQLSKIISNKDASHGILICGTGVGMSIAANRNENIRAALVHNQFTAPRCREHNDSNVICLGAWITPYPQVEEILDSWLGTSFGEGRHVKRIEKLSSKQEEIIFTNGVFDIIHTGHIELLTFAKSLGNKLVVGINSDAAVKKIKGDNRPINNQEDRKKVLESLGMVDQVVIFDDISPDNLREELCPNVLVKGGEWTKEEVRERDNVSDGIKIKIYPFVENYSTTDTIKKIYGLKTWQKKS
tara:strand:- start:313 stop:1179 length:867 start_codon:yes stop_codon:yes gene_type:complete